MKQLLILLLVLIFSAGCTTINGISTKEEPSAESVYKADKDMCGEIVFSRKLDDDYNSAFKIFEAEKEVEYSKYCPGNPCHEIELESNKVQELKDLAGNIVNLDLYFMKIKDKNTGVIVSTISEAIDEKGNLYNLHWCND